MEPHKRFDQLMREPKDLNPKDWYLKQMLNGLWERSTVSNIPYPTLLPAFGDKDDVRNIIKAAEQLISDFETLL